MWILDFRFCIEEERTAGKRTEENRSEDTASLAHWRIGLVY
jgi:hypothetical protein